MKQDQTEESAMTNADIQDFAKQAGAGVTYDGEPCMLFNPAALAEFVRLVKESDSDVMSQALKALKRIPSKNWRHDQAIDALEARVGDPGAGGTFKSSTEMQPRLTVRLTSFPESNGKRNWTALLVRVEPWDGLVGNCGGISLARGELWNRVAWTAECTRFLIGERDTEPFILDYGDDIKTTEEWAGEIQGPTRLKKYHDSQDGTTIPDIEKSPT